MQHFMNNGLKWHQESISIQWLSIMQKSDNANIIYAVCFKPKVADKSNSLSNKTVNAISKF